MRWRNYSKLMHQNSMKKISLKDAMASVEGSSEDVLRDKKLNLKEGSKRDTDLDEKQARKIASGKNATMKMSRLAMKIRRSGK